MGCAEGRLGDNGHFQPLQVLLLPLGLLLTPSLGCAGGCSAGEGPLSLPGRSRCWTEAGDEVLRWFAGAACAAAAQDPSWPLTITTNPILTRPGVQWVLISLALVASGLLWFNSQLVCYFWANTLQTQSMRQKSCLQFVAWSAKVKRVKRSCLF